MLIIDRELEDIYISLIGRYKKIVREEIDELRDGFVMNYTGKLKNISVDVEPSIRGVVIDFEFEPYGLKINEGYSKDDAKERADKVGIKNYYQEIYLWYKNKRNLDEKEAKLAAYRTVGKHLRQGYKSRRSGIDNDTGFIDYAASGIGKIRESEIATDELFYAFIRQINALYPYNLYFI